MCMCWLYNMRTCARAYLCDRRETLAKGAACELIEPLLCDTRACKDHVCILSVQIMLLWRALGCAVLRTRARGYFPRSLPQDMGADAPSRFHPSPSPDWPTPRRGSRDSRRLGAASPCSVTFRDFLLEESNAIFLSFMSRSTQSRALMRPIREHRRADCASFQ